MASDDVVGKICQDLVQAGGVNSIRALHQGLKVTSESARKYLTLQQMLETFKRYGINVLSAEQISSFCAMFDMNSSGNVAVHELLLALREGGMSDTRKQTVRALFNRLVDSDEPRVNLDTLREVYEPKHHLTILSKHCSSQENWEQLDKLFNYSTNPDGHLSWEEFQAFYVGVSQLYKDNDAFQALISQTFTLPETATGDETTSVVKVSELRKKLPPGSVSAPKRHTREAPKRIVGYMGHVPGVIEMFGVTFDRCERASKVPEKVQPLQDAPLELTLNYSELGRSKVAYGNMHSYQLE